MKILYTSTVLSHICQFHLPFLEMLKMDGHEVHVAAHDNLHLKNGLQLKFTDVFHEVCFQRSPLKFANIKAYKILKKIIDCEQYDLIVCNTPMGGIITRLAARQSRPKGAKVIYMAHGFHFYRGASKKSWAVYYPIEKFMARYCDMIITITQEDYALAKERFATNIAHIHGVGVSLERYHTVDAQQSNIMRKNEKLSKNDFVILCVGELNKNKNQETLINTISLIKDKIKNLKVLLAGNGPLEDKLKIKVKELKLENNIKFLGYRTDLETITPAVDIVVSCSLREGLPLNILEAMLCKKAVVASSNRGHRELVQDGITGKLVKNSTSAEEFAQNIEKLYDNKKLRQDISENAFLFSGNYTISQVKKEYKKIIKELIV